jgi:hypothetical protein
VSLNTKRAEERAQQKRREQAKSSTGELVPLGVTKRKTRPKVRVCVEDSVAAEPCCVTSRTFQAQFTVQCAALSAGGATVESATAGCVGSSTADEPWRE